MRLGAIITYERLYLASFALGLIGSALGWNAQAAMLATNPILAAMPWVMAALTVIGIAIALLLWYFTARSPSVVAKWVVIVFAAFGAVGLLLNLLTAVRGLASAALVVAIVGKILYLAAASLLFRPDARLWFGETGDIGERLV